MDMKQRSVELELGQVTDIASHRDHYGQAARLIVEQSGDRADRPGLLRTPERFSKAYHYLLGGYQQSVEEVVGEGVFQAEGHGELVVVRQIEFYSMCEHHVLPFWGRAEVRYYPSDKILGLSKLPRIVDLFARRLQVQERLTHQIARAVDEVVRPRAVHVRVVAQHLCMMMRGIEKQHSDTYTESTRGLTNLEPFEQQRLLSDQLR